jgi:glycosyltransferase involved in cell wall biosynthesis
LIAAAAAARESGAAWTYEIEETLCFLRRRGQDELAVHRRALGLGASSHVVEERGALDPRTLGRLRRLVRERSVEIVHSHDYKADFYAFLLARLEPVLTVATAHGWPVRTLRERFVYYPADRRLLRSFARVFAVSDDLRDRLIAAGATASRVETLPNEVDVDTFRPDPTARSRVRREWGVGDGDRVIGSLGRLDPEKRLDLLIEAFATVAASRREVRLVVAGSGPLRARLEEDARRLGVLDRCRFLGHRADAEDVHRGFDVFVQTSDTEESPYSLLEAMASGTPVVATAVGETPAAVRDGIDGLLVARGDARALARAIEETLGSPAPAAIRASSARERVMAERSLRAREEHLAEHYRAVLDGRPRLAAPPTLI